MESLEAQLSNNNVLIAQLTGTVTGLAVKIDQLHEMFLGFSQPHRAVRVQRTPTPATPSGWFRTDYRERHQDSD